ncbi:hypothetical protein GCM10028796_15600 [Ramlibacter monticola]|uniref:DUF4124 domain-containing protein n=1 Tax=Ramlibacter monticola TaxID=1926872 RepID=A0A936YXH8_9BURK|nr:hypothetical protein [Ramlibacter monticola]MBL0390389.1 hypothetical protein [Ramlibacter monticola]
MNNKNVPALLGALACALAVPASAALFRCGNVFQDRPCEAASAQEAVRPGRGASAAGAPVTQRAASAASASAASTPAASSPAASTALPAGKGEEAAAVRRVASGSTAAPAAAPAATPARKGPPSLACPNLREQHTAIEGRLKSGSRPETVQMYQRQLREVEKNLVDGNC